jgi:hypothetical protein
MIRANTRMHAFVLFHLEVRPGGFEGRLVFLGIKLHTGRHRGRRQRPEQVGTEHTHNLRIHARSHGAGHGLDELNHLSQCCPLDLLRLQTGSVSIEGGMVIGCM